MTLVNNNQSFEKCCPKLLTAISIIFVAANSWADAASELKELKKLGDKAITNMSDLMNPGQDGKENRDLLKECLGIDEGENYSACRDAERAGTGLVCTLPQVEEIPDPFCSLDGKVSDSASLSYLVQKIIDWDDDFTVDFHLRGRRTSIAGHTHQFTGQQAHCEPEYVAQQEYYQVVVAIYQGSSFEITFPTSIADDLALGAAITRVQAENGITVKGPKNAFCLIETHSPPLRCNRRAEEPQLPVTPPSENAEGESGSNSSGEGDGNGEGSTSTPSNSAPVDPGEENSPTPPNEGSTDI